MVYVLSPAPPGPTIRVGGFLQLTLTAIRHPNKGSNWPLNGGVEDPPAGVCQPCRRRTYASQPPAR
eukprot:3770431-Pyramimonas_sp.AAC.1